MERDTTYGHWKVIARLNGYQIPERFSDEPPMFIGGKRRPEDMSDVTIGQLIQLGGIDGPDADYRIMDIMMGMGKDETDSCRAIEVVPFLSWVGRQVSRINRLFEQTAHKPTAKEKQAGIDKLNFGLFGMLDWYARRMGITDHDQVLDTPWMRIYKCMDMDRQTADYERRLNEISLRETRRKKK